MSTSNSDVTEELDETDLKILSKLQADSRMSYEELGSYVGMAESSVRYRVKKLEDEGVIKSYTSVLDLRKFGFDLLVFSELDVEAGREQLVAQKLQGLDNVVGLFSVSGPPDMVAIIVARNNDDLSQIVEKIRAMKEVHKMVCMLALRSYKWHLNVKVPIKVNI